MLGNFTEVTEPIFSALTSNINNGQLQYHMYVYTYTRTQIFRLYGQFQRICIDIYEAKIISKTHHRKNSFLFQYVLL
jgi:hypothetical protein